MNKLNPVAKTLVILIMLALSASCCHDKRGDAKVTGCCQVTADSCASPVTEAECEELNGLSFHEGGTCREDIGKCGVLHEVEKQ